MKTLWSTINKELKKNENIFIIREKEINKKKGKMNEYTFDEIFNIYSENEKVIKIWHEDGLCIVIK